MGTVSFNAQLFLHTCKAVSLRARDLFLGLLGQAGLVRWTGASLSLVEARSIARSQPRA